MEKKQLLYKLGEVIRERGEKTKKRHGNFWSLTLQSNIIFTHDDYNHSVHAQYPDGSDFYFGMDFGGFTGDHVSEQHFLSTIELIETEPLKKAAQL